MNPFAQIPVIDDDGVIVTESAAILIYLAKKALIPKDPAGEAQVASPIKKQMTEIAKRHLGNLDRWLTGREFVAVDQFTIADILMTHVVGVEATPELLAPYDHVRAYVERCRARPAWHRAVEAYCARVAAA